MTASPLARIVGPGPAQPEAIDRMARAAFLRRRWLCIAIDDPRLEPGERMLLDGIGTRLFGEAA